MKCIHSKSLFLFFLFFAGDVFSGYSQSFLEDLAFRWDKARAYTIAVAEAMPDSAFSFRPTTAERTFAEQLAHICAGIDLHAQIFIRGRMEEELPKEQRKKKFDAAGKSRQQLIDLISNSFDEATAVMKKFDPAKLEDTVSFFGKTRTKLQMFLLLSDHVTHHRAQLLVYLRLKGIEPPEYTDYL